MLLAVYESLFGFFSYISCIELNIYKLLNFRGMKLISKIKIYLPTQGSPCSNDIFLLADVRSQKSWL